MKRFFTVSGFTLALSLIVLNFINVKYILIITLGLTVILTASLLLDKYRKALVIPLALSASLLACLLMLFYMYAVVQPQLDMDNQTAEVLLCATEQPVTLSDGSRSFKARVISANLPDSPVNMRVNVHVNQNSDADIIPYEAISAEVQFRKIADSAFPSKGYWADKIFLRANASSVKSTEYTINSPAKSVFYIRSRIESYFLSGMSGDNAALSIALITGNKSYMSYETRQAFTKSGASHIMAVSGLHLSTAAGLVLLILKLFRAGKRIRGLSCITVPFMYMILAGFSGSITRAGIMMIVLSLGMVIGKRADALNSLGIAVFIMCLNPFAVCDIGAMLSVIAVLSLLTIYPVLNMKYKYADPFDISIKERCNALLIKLLSGFYISIVVSVATLPISYLFFGYVSIISPITNLIAVPLGSLSMLASFVGFTPVAELLNTAIIHVVKYFAAFSGSVVGFSAVSHFGLVLAGVALIFALCFIMNNRRLLKPAVAMSLVLAISVSAIDCFCVRNRAVLYFTSGGAYIIRYDDTVIVGEVDDYTDYVQTRDFIQSNGYYIDYLLIGEEDSYYSVLLADTVRTDTLIADALDDRILGSETYRKLEEYNKFNLTLAEDFKMYYNFGVAEYNIRSVRFTVGKNTGDIVLNADKVYDRNGTISLSEGEIVYLIEDKNTFSCRRINLWQE